MPQTLAFAAFQAGVPLAAVNAIVGVGIAGAVTHFVVGTAITVGAQYALSKALAPKKQVSFGQLEVTQPLPPLRVVYGRMKLGVTLGFAARSDDDFPVFGRTGVLAGHEIDAIEAHYLYGFPVILDVDGVVISAFGPLGGNFFVQLIPHLGTTTQTADADLMTWFPTQWTSAHRGRGITYAAFLCYNPTSAEDIQKIFPQGAPEYQALIRGKKLYDPTLDSTNGGSGSCRMDDESTWVWSEEQRLIKLDFLANAPGYAKGFDRVDFETWVPQILRGREAVDLKAGGTELRYRCALAYEPALESKTDIYNRIAAAGDSRIFFTSEGKIGCRGGAWDAPTVTLDVREAGIEAEFGRPDKMDSYNVLNFKFLSPAHDYIEQPGDPWKDAGLIAAAGGEERAREIDMTHVPSHAQARRLAKQFIANDNAPWVGTVKTKLHGLQAVGEERIALSFAEIDDGSGDFDGAYRVEGEISVDLETETVLLPLKATSAAIYNWDAASEEGTPPRVPGEAIVPVSGILIDDAGEPLLDDLGGEVMMSEAA